MRVALTRVLMNTLSRVKRLVSEGHLSLGVPSKPLPGNERGCPLLVTGVIGVAATGWMVEKAGAGLLGWYQAFSIAAMLCVASSLHFLAFASGDRLFGETDQF